MRKEELRSLRTLNCTPAMKRAAKETTLRAYPYRNKEVKEPKYNLLCRGQQLGKYFKLCLFRRRNVERGIVTPEYEVYINPEGHEFITRVLDDKGMELRWSSSMISNLDDMYRNVFLESEKVYYTQDTYRTINRMFKIADKPGVSELENFKRKVGLRRIQTWQQDIHNNIIWEKEKKEQAPWDEDMKLVPELPKTFEEFMRKDACKEFFIIYEYKEGGAKQGYCSRCQSFVPVLKPLHNKKTHCPKCSAPALFKTSGKINTLSTSWYRGQIIQKIKGGIVIRQFDAYQKYGMKGYMMPAQKMSEAVRTLIFDDGTMRQYQYSLYKNKKMRWIPGPFHSWYYDGDKNYPLFKRNLHAFSDCAVFRHSAAALWPELPMPLTNYLAYEKGNPCVEMLAKVGMFRLAKGLINARYDKDLIAQDETELAKMLKIDNARLKRLKAMNADVKHLRWMQLEKKANTIWPDEAIKGLGDAGLISSDFGFLPAPVDYVKAYRYIKKQSAIMGEESLYYVKNTWRDYLYMAEQLKMNVKLDYIMKPKDLKAAHDEVILLKESEGIAKDAEKLRKKYPKCEKHMEKLSKFEYSAGDYQIIAPKTIDDIVKEGRILKHCVHTCDYYFNRIQTDESYLFFLRKKSAPDMPWYTLEVESSGNIRQKRTTGDNQNKDLEAAVGFLQQWQKFFVKKLTKKEKKLGEKADMLRKENYRNLRKNQNKVWHGRLAGKLLADVLEEDFMGVIGI